MTMFKTLNLKKVSEFLIFEFRILEIVSHFDIRASDLNIVLLAII